MADYSRAQLQAAADSYASQYNIPSNIFSALIGQESSWNPYAQADGSSAYGLTQLIKGTAVQMGVTDINDPMQQLEGGAKYLALMKQQFGSWGTALAGYNQGPGNAYSSAGAAYAAKILKSAGSLPASSSVPVYDIMGNITGYTQSSDPVTAANEQGYTSKGLADMLSGKMSDIGFVVLGVVVLAGAIFMLSPSKNIVVNLAKKVTS